MVAEVVTIILQIMKGSIAMQFIKAERVCFENARDVLNYVSRFGAPSRINYDKVVDAMRDARTGGNNNKQYNRDTIIDSNIMFEGDELTFEEIVDIVYRNQKINDAVTLFKCIGSGLIGYAIGRMTARVPMAKL